MTSNIQTEQLTQAGQQIEHDSFAIVDREAGSHAYRDDQWQIVRRMIHATADFEFNGLAEFSATAVEAGIAAILAGAPIVADVEMICVGLSQPRLAHFGIQTHQFIADSDVIEAARSVNSTRAVQAMRKAQGLGLLNGGIVAVGNAPTALLEVLRMIDEEGVTRLWWWVCRSVSFPPPSPRMRSAPKRLCRGLSPVAAKAVLPWWWLRCMPC